MANKKKTSTIIGVIAAIAGTYAILRTIGKKKVKEDEESFKNDPDAYEISTNDEKETFYEAHSKRAIDVILSFFGLVLLSPLYLLITLAIKIDDPGPVLFTQKRVGKNKKFFKLHKFRSMKMDTPHDMPTHMLENPDQYITRVGKFLRKSSLDELPQIWDIFVGNMSIIGPRPALWNQKDLVEERDHYGANDVTPGLTGWAQINGRDELEIPVKAKLDGDYVKAVRSNSFKGLLMDIKCFFGTISSVAKSEGIVEGGTGEMHKALREGVPEEDIEEDFAYRKSYTVDRNAHKKVLITGANSYIGESFKDYALKHYPDNFAIDTVDMISPEWRNTDFSQYDIVYHVAGLAHADVGHVSDEVKEKYYKVNTDLTIEVAKKAKAAGVKQFIFMSSMIVYGESAPFGKAKMVDETTIPAPANFYGDSKWQADKALRALADDSFKVAVIRPPMIYGKGSKGNYPVLAKLAKKLPVFPNVNNERSMLHIENLCEFLSQLMLTSEGGIFMPQNSTYTKTADMVKEIASVSGHKMAVTALLNPFVALASHVPGKVSGLVNKAFGNMTYDMKLSHFPGMNYNINSLKTSIEKTEDVRDYPRQKHILVISQYFYPENFRINDMASEWVKRGYKVTVLTGIPNYPQGEYYEGYDLKHHREEDWNGMHIIRIPLVPRGHNAIGMVMNYMSFVTSGMIWNVVNKIDADYVFTFEVSPMTQALIGCRYAKKHHVPHYLYVQDLWPENVEIVTGITNPMIIKPINKMVDYIYKHTDQIFTTSPSFVDAITHRDVPVDEHKVHYWPQYAEEFYHPVKHPVVDDLPDNDTFKVIFTGNIGYAQGLDILPSTAEHLKDKNIQFVIVGDGRYKDELVAEIQKRGIEDLFIFTGRIDAKEIPNYLSACDVAFLSFMDTPLFTKTIPAKLQSYMACAMPIVAVADGETKRIIQEAACGYCSPFGDDQGLADLLIKMKSENLPELGAHALDYFNSHFTKKMLMDEIDTYFQEGDA